MCIRDRPEPASRSPEPGVIRETDPTLPVRSEEFEAGDMGAETTGDVVILSMHIVGQTPTEGHEARTWSDSQKPSLLNNEFQNLVQRDPGFGPKQSRRRVEGNEAVETTRKQGIPPVVEWHVALGTAIAVR